MCKRSAAPFVCKAEAICDERHRLILNSTNLSHISLTALININRSPTAYRSCFAPQGKWRLLWPHMYDSVQNVHNQTDVSGSEGRILNLMGQMQSLLRWASLSHSTLKYTIHSLLPTRCVSCLEWLHVTGTTTGTIKGDSCLSHVASDRSSSDL